MLATLIPAYGRRYESAEAMQADWTAGKDFQIYQGPYCSIRDAETLKLEYDINAVALSFRALTVVVDL